MSDYLTLINRAGKQRMLTQKLMKLVFIKTYEISYDNSVDEEIMEIIESFNTTQIMLMNYPDNTKEVKANINKTHNAWMNFILSIHVKSIDTVVELNSIVLIEMEKLVNLLIKQFQVKPDIEAV